MKTKNKPYKKDVFNNVVIVLIFLFIISFSLRFIYLNQIKSTPFFIPTEYSLDEYYYDSRATEIVGGEMLGRSIFQESPFYQYFLSFVYGLFGHDVFIAKLIQSIVGSLTCVLIFLVSKNIFNIRIAIIAGVIASLYNMSIYYVGVLVPSILATFFVCVVIFYFSVVKNKPTNLKFLLGGFILSVSILLRPNLLLSVPFIVLWSIFYSDAKSRKKSSIYAICVIVGVILGIMPVTIRNYMVGNDFVLLTAHGGINFYIGNSEKSRGTYFWPESHKGTAREIYPELKEIAEKRTGRELKESEVSSYWYKKGVSFIIDNPLKYLRLFFKKTLIFINSYEVSDMIDFYFFKRYSFLLRMPLPNFKFIFPFFILGIILSLRYERNNSLTILLYFLILSYSFSVILFFITSRLRLPIVPIMIIFSAYSIHHLFFRIRKVNIKWGAAFFLILIISYIVSNIKVVSYSYANTYHRIALYYEQEGQIKEAILQYNKAIELDQNNSAIYTGLGNLYYKNYEYDRAIEVLKKAIKIDRNNEKAHHYLGLVYSSKKIYDKAMMEIKKAIEINPSNAISHYNLGIIYDLKNLFDLAIDEYKKAIELDSSYVMAYSNLGTVYAKKGLFEKAKIEWQKALKIDPNHKVTLSNLRLLGSTRTLTLP